MMTEVFKTNICNEEEAARLVIEIEQAFKRCKVNFDLSDCDKILRVVCDADRFRTRDFIHWLKTKGCIAEALPD